MHSTKQINDVFKNLSQDDKTFFQYWLVNSRHYLIKHFEKYIEMTGNKEIDFDLFSKYFFIYSPEIVTHNLN